MVIMCAIGFLGLVLMIVGFWREDLVVWVIDTIVWLVWSYIAYNTISIVGNTFIPTAVTMLGAALVLVCIYKDFARILSMLRRRDQPMTYDEEIERQQHDIFINTRRRF